MSPRPPPRKRCESEDEDEDEDELVKAWIRGSAHGFQVRSVTIMGLPREVHVLYVLQTARGITIGSGEGLSHSRAWQFNLSR